jgi:hypothetical protein
LGLEIIIPTSSKNKNALSLNTIIHITLANHFAINILSHTLFNFLYHLSIIGERKKKKNNNNNNKGRTDKAIKSKQIKRVS